MLIQNAEIYQTGLNDLRIERGVITDIGRLTPHTGETVLDACGGALLPGLNDHHIHFLSFAASLTSVDCSPAAVSDHDGLAAQLQRQPNGDHWLRGIGYHESVAGELDCYWLDRHGPNRPIRIQHRTGRLWIFNSAGLAILQDALAQQSNPPELAAEGFATGRFYDADQALAALLGRNLPQVTLASETLASYGITGFSDVTPSNDQDTFALFHRLKAENLILQTIQLARHSAFKVDDSVAAYSGPVKIHLHESRLPPLEELVERIGASHAADVAVAIHCVTEIEMLFSLAALEEAGTITGDRIEHASIAPPHVLERIKELGLTVVTQPHFILQKGDAYLRDVEPDDHESLYRCRSFLDRGIPLAGSSDAPFGSANPWTAMQAAVARKTRSGQPLGINEALSPEQALALFLGSLKSPGQIRKLQPGMAADLCLLAYPWDKARTRLTSDDVRWVFCNGQTIYQNPLAPAQLA